MTELVILNDARELEVTLNISAGASAPVTSYDYITANTTVYV